MLWDDFLNSEWHDWRGSGKYEDRLNKQDWLKTWLSEHRISVSRLPNEEEMEALKQFRALLHHIVKETVKGIGPSSEELNYLNKVMAAGPVIRHIVREDNGYQLEQVSARRDWLQVMADIAGSFAETLSEAGISRIRICDNSDCRWVYYDDTRNRSKRYCDDKLCGNLMKVRRFRARQKAASAEKPKT